MKFSYYTLLLLGVLLFQNCEYSEIKKEMPDLNKVKANSKFSVRLPEDHRTGYTWQLKESYDARVVERINEVWHGNEKGIYFNLGALASGQTTLTFVARKHTDTSDIKHFIVKIADK